MDDTIQCSVQKIKPVENKVFLTKKRNFNDKVSGMLKNIWKTTTSRNNMKLKEISFNHK